MAVLCRYPAGSSIAATVSHRSNTRVNASWARSSASARLPVMTDMIRRRRSFWSSKNSSNGTGSPSIDSPGPFHARRRPATFPISMIQHLAGPEPVGTRTDRLGETVGACIPPVHPSLRRPSLSLGAGRSAGYPSPGSLGLGPSRSADQEPCA
jgi:hypothetical protein